MYLDGWFTRMCGLVLIGASVVKISTVCHGCPEFCVLGSCSVNIAVACFEIVAGLTIVFGSTSFLKNRTAIGTYLLLFLAAFASVIYGGKSCGCFGYLPIKPVYMLIFDGAVLTSLVLLSKPRMNDQALSKRAFKKQVLAAILSGIFAIGLGTGLNAYARMSIANQGYLAVGGLVILQPESWINSDYPQNMFEELGVQLNDDVSKVVFVRGRCEHCRRFLSESFPMTNRSGQPKTLVVVLPPSSSMGEFARQLGLSQVVYGGPKKVVMPTPWLLDISDGKIVNSSKPD